MKRAGASRYDQLSPSSHLGANLETGLNRIWIVSKGTGAKTLTVQFATPGQGDGHQILDLSPWLKWPNLYAPFADAFVRWARDKTPRSTEGMRVNLRSGWFAYLLTLENSDEITLEDLNATLVNGFVRWLDQPADDGSEKWAKTTRAHRYSAFRSIVLTLREIPLWAESLSPDLVLTRDGPWIGLGNSTRRTPALASVEFEALYLACLKEIRNTKSQVQADWALLKQGRNKLPSEAVSQASYKDLDVCLAELDRSFPDVIPGYDVIRERNRHLSNGILTFHSLDRVTRSFQPSPRNLIPFALMLGIYFLTNGDSLLSISSNDTFIQEVMGMRRIVLAKFKARANASQRRSFLITGDDDNPHAILEWLARWTARIRTVAPPEFRHHALLFVSERRQPRSPTVFLPKQNKTSASIRWRFNLNQFLKDHHLKNITLRTIRATGIDQIALLFDGDIRAILAAGGQARDRTLSTHYTSGRARTRTTEKLAEVVELRSRWVLTKGRIDPRKRLPRADRGSATPGWHCLDPYDSPIAGQRAGHLCTAYGACPLCPLAQTDTSSSYALARHLQLQEVILVAQAYLPAVRWLSFWANVLDALRKRWLPQFDNHGVIAAAKRLHLSPLPALE